MFFFSTDVTDAQRKEAENTRSVHANKGRQPAGGVRTPPVDIEHGGTGALLSPKVFASLLDFVQVSGRILTFTLDMVGPPLHIITAYARQSGCNGETKTSFYSCSEEDVAKCPAACPTFISGDFNARLHANLGANELCIG